MNPKAKGHQTIYDPSASEVQPGVITKQLLRVLKEKEKLTETEQAEGNDMKHLWQTFKNKASLI